MSPINPVREKSLQATEVSPTGAAFSNGVNETNMTRIWNKFTPLDTKSSNGAGKLNPHTKNFGVGVNTPLKPRRRNEVSLQGRRKVFVGMSGGVDSSVAAALLKRGGFDVTGVFMKNWPPAPDSEKSMGIEKGIHHAETPAARINQSLEYGKRIGAGPVTPDYYSCSWKEDRRDAMRVAAMLDIPFQTWDFTKEYKDTVVAYMLREYAEGRTPNPDVMCNREIKFGIFLKKALSLGADYVATGHYVRQEPEFPISNFQFPKKPKIQSPNDQSKDGSNFENSYIENSLRIENCKLKIARDLNKDQSYFLWTLTQNELKHAVFPIGDYKKPEVRTLAKELGLPTAEKPDSQGVCFVGEIDVAEFLRDHIPSKRGKVLTSAGRNVGEHDGVQFYTIGQRHGLGVGGGIPFYVAQKDTITNTLVVAEGPHDDALFSKELMAANVNWISGVAPKFPLRCEARIRYRQPLQSCRIENIANYELRTKEGEKSAMRNAQSAIKVIFDEDQRAVTPGQSVVFYKNGEMLGGGIIT